MRAVGYFHLNGDAQTSPQLMEETFVAYCRSNRHQPVRCYIDENRDGQTKTPEYELMLDGMRGSTDKYLVLIPDARHLGTSLESVARAMVDLEDLGAKVSCMDDELPDPLQNAFHSLGVKGVSRTRSAHIKQSMRERALQGKALGRPLFGYRIGEEGKLKPVPQEASVVELIYRLYTKDGLGLRLIAQHLNEREIRTRSGRNWNVVTIRDILKNPAYTGTYNRFGLTVPRTHEAIIPRDVFNVAQEQARSRRPVGRVMNVEPFDLSGLVHCGYCGNKMMGATRRQSWRRKDGRRVRGVYRYYQCQSRNNQSVCGYHTWRAARLEATILSQLRYALKARESAAADPVEQGRQIQRIRDLRQTKLNNTERKLNLALRRAAQGAISMRVIGEYLRELDEARIVLQAPIEPGNALDKLMNWDDIDPGERRRFLEENVVRADVTDDIVEVHV